MLRGEPSIACKVTARGGGEEDKAGIDVSAVGGEWRGRRRSLARRSRDAKAILLAWDALGAAVSCSSSVLFLVMKQQAMSNFYIPSRSLQLHGPRVFGGRLVTLFAGLQHAAAARARNLNRLMDNCFCPRPFVKRSENCVEKDSRK